MIAKRVTLTLQCVTAVSPLRFERKAVKQSEDGGEVESDGGSPGISVGMRRNITGVNVSSPARFLYVTNAELGMDKLITHWAEIRLQVTRKPPVTRTLSECEEKT